MEIIVINTRADWNLFRPVFNRRGIFEVAYVLNPTGAPRRVRPARPAPLHVPIGSNRLSSVMPVPGLDPGIVAGIPVFLAHSQQEDVGGRDKPGHD
jgi:hypothetical protein